MVTVWEETRKRLEDSRIAIKARIDSLAEAAEALDRASMVIQRLGGDGEPRPRGVTPRELVGLSIGQAAMLIARDNGGVLEVTSARRMMVAAGIVPEGTNGAVAVYRTLKESDHFRHGEGRGVWHLV